MSPFVKMIIMTGDLVILRPRERGERKRETLDRDRETERDGERDRERDRERRGKATK